KSQHDWDVNPHRPSQGDGEVDTNSADTRRQALPNIAAASKTFRIPKSPAARLAESRIKNRTDTESLAQQHSRCSKPHDDESHGGAVESACSHANACRSVTQPPEHRERNRGRRNHSDYCGHAKNAHRKRIVGFIIC